MKVKGFTLIELLIVIGIIAILAAAVIIAINPGTQFTQARNSTRENHANSLSNALLSYSISNQGNFPTQITSLLQEVCNTGNEETGHSIDCNNKVDLSELVPEYINAIPKDPRRASTDTGTGYYVAKDHEGINTTVVQGLKEIQCPENYVGVPGNPMYGTQDFCVMKYEAKAWDTQEDEVVAFGCDDPGCTANWAGNSSQTRYEARSVPEGYPWRRISQGSTTQFNAKQACQTADAQLITNSQWMTIARNIEAQAENWSEGEVGSGHLSRGWSAADWSDGFQNTAPAPHGNFTCLYNTGSNACGSTGAHKLKRTQILSNTEVIWDISGNIWNWVDYIIEGVSSQPQVPNQSGWQQIKDVIKWGDILFYDMVGSGNNNWTGNQNIGRIYYNSQETDERAFRRGGHWHYGTFAGVFALYLSHSSLSTHAHFGFRCTR